MSILHLNEITVSFGGLPLMEKIHLRLQSRERIGLLGRNGVGKSTLMKLIAGELIPDTGEINKSQTLRIARLAQNVPMGIKGTNFDVVASGLGTLTPLLDRYYKTLKILETDQSDQMIKRLENCQRALENANGWRVQQVVEGTLSKFGISPETQFNTLSGGMKRRVLLAQALITEPDILLLDEPTNHLDMTTIEWLEEQILQFQGTTLFITHDRTFLKALATRIIELDRGKLHNYDCDYTTYIDRRNQQLVAESARFSQLDKKLAKEERWIREGVKARRTRSESRIRALEKLRRDREARRERQNEAEINLVDASRSGKLVLEAKALSVSFPDTDIFSDFNAMVLRGDRIGIIGSNGAGKTTLIKTLLGQIKPTSGSVRLGTNLKIVTFDQLRETLDDQASVIDNLNHGSEFVHIGNIRKHVIGYLQDFLFSPERARGPARMLSGGERNRLLIARLFLKPANLLFMDEPTNDLDLETLDILRDTLLSFKGTLIVVSHDRDFLDQVVTSIWAFNSNGTVREYIGGYSDWLRQKSKDDIKKPKQVTRQNQAIQKNPAKKKLAFHEKREYEALKIQLEEIEMDIKALEKMINSPDFFSQDSKIIESETTRHRDLNEEYESKFERFIELDERAN